MLLTQKTVLRLTNAWIGQTDMYFVYSYHYALQSINLSIKKIVFIFIPVFLRPSDFFSLRRFFPEDSMSLYLSVLILFFHRDAPEAHK